MPAVSPATSKNLVTPPLSESVRNTIITFLAMAALSSLALGSYFLIARSFTLLTFEATIGMMAGAGVTLLGCGIALCYYRVTHTPKASNPQKQTLPAQRPAAQAPALLDPAAAVTPPENPPSPTPSQASTQPDGLPSSAFETARAVFSKAEALEELNAEEAAPLIAQLRDGEWCTYCRVIGANQKVPCLVKKVKGSEPSTFVNQIENAFQREVESCRSELIKVSLHELRDRKNPPKPKPPALPSPPPKAPPKAPPPAPPPPRPSARSAPPLPPLPLKPSPQPSPPSTPAAPPTPAPSSVSEPAPLDLSASTSSLSSSQPQLPTLNSEAAQYLLLKLEEGQYFLFRNESGRKGIGFRARTTSSSEEGAIQTTTDDFEATLSRAKTEGYTLIETETLLNTISKRERKFLTTYLHDEEFFVYMAGKEFRIVERISGQIEKPTLFDEQGHAYVIDGGKRKPTGQDVKRTIEGHKLRFTQVTIPELLARSRSKPSST